MSSKMVVLVALACSVVLAHALPTQHVDHLGVWPFPPKDPDDGIDMIGIVVERGYPIEQHFATTSDGYILQIFRIPHGANENPDPEVQKPVVLIQHCLLCSSFDFVNNMGNESLAYILADAGFDVWLPNNRGNTYSLNHTTFSVDSKEFWDFSWDEMALYDLPAEFDYILSATNKTSLTYVGHSQGTAQAFAGFSVNPSLASRVNLFVALAPIAFVGHSRSPIFSLLAKLDVAEIFQWFGIKQFLPSNSFLSFFAPILCKDIPNGCDTAIFLFCGPTHHLNATRMQVYTAHTPAGTSVKNMLHWSQQIKQDTFTMFDYGNAKDNMAKYNSTTPPAYPLQNLHVPIAMYMGGNDILADATDLARLISMLPESSVIKQSKQDSWAHLDYAWTFEGQQVFADIVDTIKNTTAAAELSH